MNLGRQGKQKGLNERERKGLKEDILGERKMWGLNELEVRIKSKSYFLLFYVEGNNEGKKLC